MFATWRKWKEDSKRMNGWKVLMDALVPHKDGWIDGMNVLLNKWKLFKTIESIFRCGRISVSLIHLNRHICNIAGSFLLVYIKKNEQTDRRTTLADNLMRIFLLCWTFVPSASRLGGWANIIKKPLFNSVSVNYLSIYLSIYLFVY